jgi:hypothetical protein
LHSIVFDRQANLTLERHISLFQFIANARLIYRFKQSWT